MMTQHAPFVKLAQKKQSKTYGPLPEKEAEAMPWDRLCINLIVPYNI
jgi:hypothetical protein